MNKKDRWFKKGEKGVRESREKRGREKRRERVEIRFVYRDIYIYCYLVLEGVCFIVISFRFVFYLGRFSFGYCC